MTKKLTKKENYENLSKLKTSCTKCCDHDKTDELKKFYMNKHGGYMSARIISVLLMEFFAIIIIMQTGIDSEWASIPYADTIVYGTMWGSGGIYLLQMMIRIVFNTYDLKMALEAGKVKVSDCLISLHIEHANTSNDILSMYMHANKKNELISIDKKRLKSISISHNINSGDSSGTKLLVYIVDDKKHDTFIMVKDRHIGDTTDKAIVNIVGDELSKHKVKLSIVKDKFRNKKK